MRTRDFRNSEYGVFKIIGFIYIWLFAMFFCSNLDFNKPRTTGTKILKLLEDNV